MDQSAAGPDAPRPSDSPADAPAPDHAWREELSRAHDTSNALAVGRFTLDGEPIYLNCGMHTVLGGATPDRPRRDYLVNPSFAQLLRDSEQRFRRIVEHIADPVMVTDWTAHIRTVNPAFSRVTGYDPAEVLGRTPKILASGHHPPATYADMRHRLGSEGHWLGNIWSRRKNGELYAQRLSIASLRDSAAAGLYIAVYSDIGEEIRALERARFQAEHDALTGLPNRVLLFDRLSEALRDSRRRGTQVGVLFIDLDRFKPINDTHGHAAGDTVLQSIAERLKRSVRDTDSVARLGGDEFVVVLRDVEAPDHARQVAHEIQAALTKPIWLSGLSVRVSASIGVALGPQAGETAEDLLHRADQAMYAAKRVRPPPHPLPGRMDPLANRRGHPDPNPHDQAGD